jgi:uncharacterized protein
MAQAAKTQDSKTPESKAEARTHEPSMEEILASIRRIIADEDAYASARGPAGPAKGEAKPMTPALPQAEIEQTSNSTTPATTRRYEYEALSVSERFESDTPKSSNPILDLTEPGAAPTAKSSEPEIATEPKAGAGPGSFLNDRETAEFDEAGDRMPMPSFAETSKEGRDRLLSQETSAAVDSAFNALAQTVLVHNARTLEDLVREMLRPLLKSWLDDNLPSMVERLVRAEIERVSRGRSS